MEIDFPDFTPHPFCRNSHMQTVLSVYVPTTFKPPNGDSRKILTQDDDTIVIRENTEGEYSSVGGRMFKDTDREIAIQETIMSRHGIDRVRKFAFELAILSLSN